MPNLKKPSEEAYQKYISTMQEKLKQLKLLPPEQYVGFFPKKSEGGSRANAFGRFHTAVNTYIKAAPNGLSDEERDSLIKHDAALRLQNAMVITPPVFVLKNTLDIKYLLESKAPDGRTHFENMMDFAYASGFSDQDLKDVVSTLNEDLSLDLQVPELQLNRVPNPGLQGREQEKKSALDWISEFKADARRAALGGGQKPDTDWLVNTLAARSLANSDRHKSAKLKDKKITGAQIATRANQLMADKGVRDYINALKNNPQEYARAVELLQKGNGGRVEDQLTAFLVAGKAVSVTDFGRRYRPTVKQVIELQQGTLKNPQSTPEEKQEALASIIAVRKIMGVNRATMGLVGDDTLKDKISNYGRFQERTAETLQELQKLDPQQQSRLMTEACSGHGGAMVQNYDKLIRQAGAKPAAPQAERGQQQQQVVPGKS